MCDIWVATKDSTLEGRVIFAKNSDRPIFDCQPLFLRARENWPVGSRIQTEYVELPQVQVTYAHLGSSPYWCWGYEEGMNEYGVVIGNEAVYTKAFREASEVYQPGSQALGGGVRFDLERAKPASGRWSQFWMNC